MCSAFRGMKLFGPLAMDNGLKYALDTFNTAIVSPIYYAGFTSFTILASAIMFKDYSGQSASSIVSELCGFVTVLSGTFILHSTREPDPPILTDLYTPLSPKVSWYIQSNGEHWKQKDEEGTTSQFYHNSPARPFQVKDTILEVLKFSIFGGTLMT
ncbi:hypothetical protein OIU74_024176 [Salix koriyanagi]|uniref:Probable magnesium transporter n=1 Tax=Salix koriyanagi TaxID=2511006 RepID=A0A9Q1A7V0_9ROSI|nr:hypothetical protein OIU74_024176 [Salix koriyanagi]